MPQVISWGGIYTGQNDANGNPVIKGMVNNAAPRTWTGPLSNKSPSNLSYVQGVAQYPAPGQELPQTIDETNCGNGSEYTNPSGSSLSTTRYLLVNGTWTGG